MDATQKRQPIKAAAKDQNTVQAIGEVNSTATVIHINNSYNVINNGQRIGSFLTLEKAIAFAGQVLS